MPEEFAAEEKRELDMISEFVANELAEGKEQENNSLITICDIASQRI